jgi:hypothetical protein
MEAWIFNCIYGGIIVLFRIGKLKIQKHYWLEKAAIKEISAGHFKLHYCDN